MKQRKTDKSTSYCNAKRFVPGHLGAGAFIIVFIAVCLGLVGCQAHNKKEKALHWQTEEPQPSETLNAEQSKQANVTKMPERTAQPAEIKTSEQEKQPVTLCLTGDVFLGEPLVRAFHEQGALGVLDSVVLDVMKNADLTLINHEYACTNETKKVDYQLYNFRSAPENEYILRELGVDIAGLSNNHILDYGVTGMTETIETLRALGIDCVGAGSQIEEAKSAVIKEINGKRIAFLAASHFVPSTTWHASPTNAGILTTYEGTENYQTLMECIAWLKAEAQAEFIVIFAHYGIEKQHEFVAYQQNLSHDWIDAGADLVVGSHAHELQGIEQYKGKYIFYNLGNFLFGSYAKQTMALCIEIGENNEITPKIMPCLTKNYYVRSMNQEEAQKLYQFLQQMSVNILIDENGKVSGA